MIKKNLNQNNIQSSSAQRMLMRYCQIAGLMVIFIVALFVRLYPVINSPEQRRSGLGQFVDTELYHKIAYNLYKGHGFSGTDDGGAYGMPKQGKEFLKYEPTFTRAPGYPFFVFLVYKVLGNPYDMLSLTSWRWNWDKVRKAQCVLDSLTCVILFLIVQRIYPAWFGPPLLAAALYAFSFYNIYYTRALLSETLATFLLSLAVFFCISGLNKEKIYWWGLTGVSFGFVCLVRPEYMLFPFLLIVLIFWSSRNFLSLAANRSAVLIISFILVIAPWTLRNYYTFGKPIIISKGGLGYSLYLGTFETNRNWRGWGVFPDEIFESQQAREEIEVLYRKHESLMRVGGVEIVEADDAFKQFALKRIREDPLGCFKIWITRIPRLWFQKYIQIYGEKEASGSFFIFYFLFAIYAFVSSKTLQRILMMPIVYLFFYLSLIFLPLHIEPRYSVAVMPTIIALAAIGLCKIFLLEERYFPSPI